MFTSLPRKTLVCIAVCMLIAVVTVLFFYGISTHDTTSDKQSAAETPSQATPYKRTLLGSSVEGRAIEAYVFESTHPRRHVVFVGGIHGGYEWNTVALAYKTIDYLNKNASKLPHDVRITIIPNLNPDGVFKVLGIEGKVSEQNALQILAEKDADTTLGRFNANDVDLNRNFACNWQPKAMWKGKSVRAGDEVFSEPEAQTFKTFIDEQVERFSQSKLSVVFWHSKADAVYASSCGGKPFKDTLELLHTYAEASGYKAVESFDAYPVTGAAEDWLSSLGVPAITVELSTHENLDWDKNRKGIDAVLKTLH